MAVTQSGGMGESVNIILPGHEYVLSVSKDNWPASGQTSSMTTMKGMSSTSRIHTPTQQTSSLPAVIPSTSTAGTQHTGTPPGGPPPGFPAFLEVPIEGQAAIREQTDTKILTNASQVLCTDFCHMGEYYSKQWKALRECQLQGIHDLKTTVQKALSDWRVDLSSRQHLLGTVPSASPYNSMVADLRVKTYKMANKVKQAEAAYEERKDPQNIGPDEEGDHRQIRNFV